MIVMKPVNSPILFVLILLIPAVLVAGCASSPSSTATGTPSPEPASTSTATPTAVLSSLNPGNDAALQIRASVSHPANYSIEALRQYPSFSAPVLFKDNNTYDLNGISLNRLLDDVGVMANATSVKLIASDGYEMSVGLQDIRASSDAMIHFGTGLPICCASDNLGDNELKVIIPGQPFKTWASHLTIIEVT